MAMLEKTSSGFKGIHGEHCYGIKNSEHTRVFDISAAADLVTTNTCFTKFDCHLLTNHSDNACSQIESSWLKSDFKPVHDVKVIGREECVSHYKLLVGDLELNTTLR